MEISLRMNTRGPLTNSEKFEKLKERDQNYQKDQDKIGQRYVF